MSLVIMGRRQVERHSTLTAAFVGSNPTGPVIQACSDNGSIMVSKTKGLGSIPSRPAGDIVGNYISFLFYLVGCYSDREVPTFKECFAKLWKYIHTTSVKA